MNKSKEITLNRAIIGKIGEEIACRFLMKHQFSIINRNVSKKLGEIDIVAKKKNDIYFIEVKTLSTPNGVIRETFENIFPENQITFAKGKKFKRSISLFCLEKNISHEDVQVGLIAVIIDKLNLSGRIRFYPEIVL